jgi:hypothetical protein
MMRPVTLLALAILLACGEPAEDTGPTRADLPTYAEWVAAWGAAACDGCDDQARCLERIGQAKSLICAEWEYDPEAGAACMEAIPAGTCWALGVEGEPAVCAEACG